MIQRKRVRVWVRVNVCIYVLSHIDYLHNVHGTNASTALRDHTGHHMANSFLHSNQSSSQARTCLLIDIFITEALSVLQMSSVQQNCLSTLLQ